MADLKTILDGVQAPDTVKADAWDAVTTAKSPDELKFKLDRLPLSKDVRAQLWDAKGAMDDPAAPANKPESPGFFGHLWRDFGGPQALDFGNALLGDQAAAARTIDTAKGMVEGLRREPERIGTELEGAVQGVTGVNPTDVVLGLLGNKEAADRAVHATLRSTPVDTVRGLMGDQPAANRAVQNANAAIYHGVGAVPLLGAQAQASADATNRGDWQAGLAHAVSLIAPFMAPEAWAAFRARYPNLPLVPKIFQNRLNPMEQASTNFLNRENITTPVSIQTGSRTARNLEGVVQNEPGGAGYAASKIRQTSDEMQALAQRKLAAISPQPVTAEQAGTQLGTQLQQDLEAERNAVSSRVQQSPSTPEQAGRNLLQDQVREIEKHNTEANQHYNQAWQIERDPRNFEDVPATGKDGKPIFNEDGTRATEPMALPIDYNELKDVIAPIARRYERTLTLTDRPASPGLTAMRQILDGPRYVPASTAELDLGMLKEAARTEEGLAALRDPSQGMAAYTLKKLQDLIEDKVGSAVGGQQALPELQAGRASTAAKYDVKESAQRIFGKRNITEVEPVQAFQRMTWGKDAGLDALREMAQRYPDRMPEIGRAYIDSGGSWDQLGAGTKKVLFNNDQQLISDLDSYYQKQKRLGPLTQMEPVRLVDRLTTDRDATIRQLRDVAAQAPQHTPILGRAVMQEFVDRMLQTGDFSKVDSTFNAYHNLGPEGKNILLGSPAAVNDWDNLMFSLKRLAHNPNPSGSGYIVNLGKIKQAAATGLGAALGGTVGGAHGAAVTGGGLGIIAGQGLNIASNAVLARMLYNPAFRKLMTQGIQMQLSGNMVGAAAAAAQLARMLPKDGVQQVPAPGVQNGGAQRPQLSSFERPGQ